MTSEFWNRVKGFFVHYVLGLDDTPQRIALGVLLGTIIAFSPLFGFHTILYFALAALIGANKISGLPTLYISNVFTAGPIYYLCWKLGKLLSSGVLDSDRHALKHLDSDHTLRYFAHIQWTKDPFTAQFWRDTWDIAGNLGLELWLGGTIVGLALGIPLYFLAYWSVKGFRASQRARLQSGDKLSDSPAS